MKRVTTSFLRNLVIVIFATLTFYSCKNNSENLDAPKKYSLHILDKDGKEYIVSTNELDSGAIFPEQLTTALDDSISRNMIVKNGYYFQLRRKSDVFTKYALVNNKLKPIANLALKDYAEENFNWIGQDTILLSGLNQQANTGKYYLIDTKKMAVISSGFLDIDKPSGQFNSTSIGFVEKKKDTLFVAYTFNKMVKGTNYTTSDTMYLAKLLYPSMKNVSVQTDTRTTYPGGINTVQSNDFKDEKGNYYFMACPGIAMGNRPDLPTAVLKINQEDGKIDKNYFFSLSSSIIYNHAYGLWYIGNGKAIVRSERKDLFKGLSDHYSVPHFEFYLLDIVNRKVIKKLDLPLDKGTRKECVLVKGNDVYIAVNSSTEGNYIWKYDIEKDILTKGLQLKGVTDFIVRLDKLTP